MVCVFDGFLRACDAIIIFFGVNTWITWIMDRNESILFVTISLVQLMVYIDPFVSLRRKDYVYINEGMSF
jgi:hypothetical protein